MVSQKDVTRELKLGKFEKRAPLHLPEKQVRRGWQIVGALVLMLLAAVGVYFLIIFGLLLDDGVMSWQASLADVKWYELLIVAAVAVVTILCIVASIMMLAKRKVPMGIWYVMIVMGLIGLVGASLHKFERYEQRECYKNYPGVVSMGYPCPSVVNELTLVVGVDIAICGIGGLVIWGVHKATREDKRR